MTFELTEETFIMYAIKHYDNPYCKGMVEFLDDIKIFKSQASWCTNYLGKNRYDY